MPIYEYVCDDCGYDFERIQSFDADPVATCPTCGGAVRRVISPVGVIFKGSGWYITDSKRQLTGGKAKAPAADGANSGTAKADEAPKATESPKADAGEKAGGGTDKTDKADKPAQAPAKDAG